MSDDIEDRLKKLQARRASNRSAGAVQRLPETSRESSPLPDHTAQPEVAAPVDRRVSRAANAARKKRRARRKPAAATRILTIGISASSTMVLMNMFAAHATTFSPASATSAGPTALVAPTGVGSAAGGAPTGTVAANDLSAGAADPTNTAATAATNTPTNGVLSDGSAAARSGASGPSASPSPAAPSPQPTPAPAPVTSAPVTPSPAPAPPPTAAPPTAAPAPPPTAAPTPPPTSPPKTCTTPSGNPC